jgi:hypothetical protein
MKEKLPSMRDVSRKILIPVLAFMALAILPIATLADTPAEPGQLVPNCGGNNGACGYDDLIKLGQNVLTWSIYLVALCSVAAIAYAGFLYLTSGGDSGKISKAHGIFITVIWGIVITLGAYLIVKSVLGWLGVKQDFSLL